MIHINILPFGIGALAASYIQNPKFRATVDKAVKDLINKGVDSLNKKEFINKFMPPMGGDDDAGTDNQPDD